MCRLFMSDKRGLEKLGKEAMLIFLDHLEKQCGGHGNGVAFIDKVDGTNMCTLVHKGMEFSNKDIVDMVYRDMPDWFIYHTRVASKGSIKDSNCHPYWNDDKSFVLAMNGTVGQFGDLAKSLDITDTELVFKNLETFNINENNLKELSPRFLGFRNGKVFATNPSGFGGLVYDDDNCVIIASSFPTGYEKYTGSATKDMDDYYVWHEGEEIKEKEKRVIQYNYNPYWWNQQYTKQKEQDKKDEKKTTNPIHDIEIEEKELEVGLETMAIFSDIELLDLVDEANGLIKEGMIGEDIEVYLKDYLGGSLEVNTVFGKLTFKVTDKQVTLLDDIGDLYY